MTAKQTTGHSNPPEPETDVVVIGAGIVGCASAYYLARRGVRVTLLEQGNTIGEQSRKNWGFVRQQGRDPDEVPLMIASNRIWREMEDELEADIEWTQGGNLALAATEDRLARFEQWLDVARDHELDSRILTHREITDILPGVEGAWLGGLYTPSDGHAEPGKTTDALLHAAERHGARLHASCAVQRILTQGGNTCGVATTHGDIRATHVVCAAGAWSSRLVQPLGISLPQRWVRATVARTTAAPPLTRAGVWAPGVSFRQRRDGTFNIAAGGAADHDLTLESLRHMGLFLPNYWRNRHLFRFHLGQPFWRDLATRLDPSKALAQTLKHDRGDAPIPNPKKVERSLVELKRLFPALQDLSVTESWAGYIDATPDVVPVIGETPAHPGLIIATGFSGHGFAMGPIAGRLVAELICDGQPSLDLHAFRLSRFAEEGAGKPRNVL